MKYLGRICFILHLFACVGCSLDAALTNTSLLADLTPPPLQNPPTSKTFTAGIYAARIINGANGLESEILKENASGVFEKVYSPSFYAYKVFALGNNLITMGVDPSNNQQGIYLLNGSTETKIAGAFAHPTYNCHYTYDDSLYVCMADFSLIKIDAQGTVTTIATNVLFSDFTHIFKDGWLFALSNLDRSLIVGPAHNPIKYSYPGNWQSLSTMVVLNQIAYIAVNDTAASTKAILKLENGVYQVIPTPASVDSIGGFNNEAYFTMVDSGKVNLYKYSGSGTSYQLIAELGDDVFADARIHASIDDGMYISKKSVGNEYELFFYDGAFHQISNFQSGTNYDTIMYSKLIDDALLYFHNGDYYISSRSQHYVLPTLPCLGSFPQISLLNGGAYITGESGNGVCKLTNQTLVDLSLPYYFGKPTEIK